MTTSRVDERRATAHDSEALDHRRPLDVFVAKRSDSGTGAEELWEITLDSFVHRFLQLPW